MKAGMQVGAYQLQTHIGRGSSGDVWHATHPGGDVALKFLRVDDLGTASDIHQRRLQREAQALAALQHVGGVPRLLSADLRADPPYIAMTYVAGITLAQYIESRHLFEFPLIERIVMLERLAHIVDAVHQAGWVHRDIKGSNVLGLPIPYLIDFSISYPQTHAPPDDHAGTPAYRPPDGIQDVTGDLYSFAVLAYEMLFARHPVLDDTYRTDPSFDVAHHVRQALATDTWYAPGRLPCDDYPADMQDIDWSVLDDIFHRALGTRDTRDPTATRLIEQVRQRIFHQSADTQPIPRVPPMLPTLRLSVLIVILLVTTFSAIIGVIASIMMR